MLSHKDLTAAEPFVRGRRIYASILRAVQAFTAGREDWIVGCALTLFALAFSVYSVRWHTAAAEDALMLLRYAKNFAAGAGIVWNVGDHPIEGATDFLYMASVAGLVRLLHGGPIASARILLVVSHVATVVLVYVGSRSLFRAPRPLAIALALYLLPGPGVVLAEYAFSGPFFGLAAMAAWWCACAIAVKGSTRARTWWFAGWCLITGLIRPDGVLLAGFMTLALAIALWTAGRRNDLMKVLASVAGMFFVVGGAYFLWRLWYFGYLLPNPFYKKGGGHIYPDSLHRSMLNVCRMLLPLLPVCALGLIERKTRVRTVFVFLPSLLFSVIWILLTNENNAAMRFQYAVVPLTLMSAPYVLEGLYKHYRIRAACRISEVNAVGLAAVLTFSMAGRYWKPIIPGIENGSGVYDIARGLHAWKDRHYTIVVTEAGVIPYFSEWRAVDAWGLNDSTMMHDPRGLTAAYLDANHPAIIMFHLANLYGPEEYARIWRGDAPDREDISQFMQVLSYYAISHHYILAARWGTNRCDVHEWFVRRDVPEAQAMVALIRRRPHFFLDNQGLSEDFRDEAPPGACSDPGISLSSLGS